MSQSQFVTAAKSNKSFHVSLQQCLDSFDPNLGEKLLFSRWKFEIVDEPNTCSITQASDHYKFSQI